MRKKLSYEYDLVSEKGKEHKVKPVEKTENPPMCFFAGAQPLVTTQWLAKQVCIEYIEELEQFIEDNMGLLDNTPDQRARARKLLGIDED